MRPVVVTAQDGVNSGNSVVVPMDYHCNPFSVGFGCVVTSGTPTFKVQHTFDDVLNSSVTPTWFDHPSVTGKTANTDGNYAFPVRGIRVVVTAGTGVVTITIIQSGTWG